MPRRGIHVALLTASVVVAGCRGGAPSEAERPARGTAHVGGQVVSTVDGEPIRLADVERVVRETGLAPVQALRRLQRGALLAREARRRGYGARAAVREAGRKAEVQALLSRAVEDAVPPSSISDDAVRQAFEEHREQFARPERRASMHVLAKVPEGAAEATDQAARALALRALAAFRRAGPGHYDRVLAAYRGRKGQGFDVVAEKLPAVDRHAPFAHRFLTALFAAEQTGPLEAPVRTRFGWHAIVVTDIEPAQQPDFDRVRDQIRARLLARERHRRLVDLAAGLERKYGVRRYPGRLKAAALLSSTSGEGAQ